MLYKCSSKRLKKLQGRFFEVIFFQQETIMISFATRIEIAKIEIKKIFMCID